jgi:divalent metal cation (Fe/Co/Zn/Cd) transporter
MRFASGLEFPREQQEVLARARRLEWWTLAYIASSALFLYLTMGSSQAMRTSFFEDVLSAVPAAAFLICTRIAIRPPNARYPYGLHGVVSIGYLVASLALTTMGLLLFVEAGIKLLSGERTTIGGMEILGHVVWAGWPMLAAVAYTAIPTFFLGRMKLRLAPKIHDKILYADAKMMKADWMAELGTAVGVLGVGFGFWWLDPVAALLISADIIKDGVTNLVVAGSDLVQHRPRKTDRSGPETLPDELRRWVESHDWVKSAQVRLRESGHIFLGEIYVEPRERELADLPDRLGALAGGAKRLNWRLHDIVVSLLEEEEVDARRGAATQCGDSCGAALPGTRGAG